MEITVRHAEPDDYEELHRIFSGPMAIACVCVGRLGMYLVGTRLVDGL